MICIISVCLRCIDSRFSSLLLIGSDKSISGLASLTEYQVRRSFARGYRGKYGDELIVALRI